MNIKQLKTLCENTELIVHNARFEHKWLWSRGINANIVDDTFLMAYCVDERWPLDLQSLCLKLNVDVPFKKEYDNDVSNMDGERLIERNIRDSRNCYLLRDILWGKMTEGERKVYKKVLLPATQNLARIELKGIHYDKTVTEGVIRELEENIAELDIQNDPVIVEFNKNSDKPFNIDSWMHKLVVVYDMLGYTPLNFEQAWNHDKDGNRTTPKTGIKILEKLLLQKPSPTIDKMIKLSSWTGWQEKYVKLEDMCDGGTSPCGTTHVHNVDGKDYVFTNLRLGNTTTGRIASNHPNMQNMPSRAGGWTRRGFTSRYKEGVLIEADYSQIELKLMACRAEEDVLIKGFQQGVDQHTRMAGIAFGIAPEDITKEWRDKGKTLNFAVPFGRGAGGIAFDLNTTIQEAQKWRKRFFKLHPKLKKYLTNVPKGGIIVSPTGMKRHCETWTQAKNFPIQNTALITLLIAINRMIDNVDADLILCIHDSVIFDIESIDKVPRVIQQIKDGMEFKPYELFDWIPIPLTVDFKIGKSLGEMKGYDSNN